MHIRRPWLVALVVSLLWLVVSIGLLLVGDSPSGAPDEPSPLLPSPNEIAILPASTVVVFLAVWGALTLLRRRASTDGSARKQ